MYVPVNPLQALHPELVHAGKGCGMLRFECLPGVQIRHRGILREARAVVRERLRYELKPDELQLMLAQERGDLGNRELMLLHMEQEIAALADTEIIRVARHRFHRRGQQLPAATADVARRRTRPLPRKTRPCRADLLPRDLAVEPDMHQPKGSQHGVQNPPSCHWICKVVQHPASATSRAVTIACCPVPQPATRMSMGRSVASSRNDAAGNWRSKYVLTCTGPRFDGANTHRG